MPLRVYNTLTRQKEPFEPVQPGKVGMYVCGPTVYKPSHVGHMVGPVIFDTVKRYLIYLGYKVTFVVNITDIDDKIINEAAKQKRDWKELAESVTVDYLRNLKALGVTGIDHFPRATEHIGDILAMIQGLIDKGYAYPSGGDVYFEVGKDPDYGKLCNRDPEQLEAGARIEVSDRKRNPGDFALWKGAKPGEPKWDSPWGPGRPGWHIECSAMSSKLLGQTLDIHGGGLDLQFPHHENELAQSESFSGRTFVKYWMHNGLMKTGDKKMSKSEGNEIVVSKLLKPQGKWEPETLRFLLLSTHYRSPIEYSEKRLEEVQRGLDGFQRFFEKYQSHTGRSFFELNPDDRIKSELKKPQEPVDRIPVSIHLGRQFREHMDDDFNTGGATSMLYGLLTHLNTIAGKLERGTGTGEQEEFKSGATVLKLMGNILGIFQEPTRPANAGSDQLLNGLMQLLLDLRADARKSKNFALADQIRQRLAQIGITLEDRPGGTGWRVG